MGKTRKQPDESFTVREGSVHKGRRLSVDVDGQTVTVRETSGEPLGTVTWDALIEYVMRACAPAHEDGVRAHPRASFLSKVRYAPLEAGSVVKTESRATGVGGGGLFIESQQPLRVGSEVSLEFTLPERPAEWIPAEGTVVWVCPKPDQYTFAAGMGIRFTKIDPAARERVVTMVSALKRRDMAG